MFRERNLAIHVRNISHHGEPSDGPCERQPIISGVGKIVTDSHLQESKKRGQGEGIASLRPGKTAASIDVIQDLSNAH